MKEKVILYIAASQDGYIADTNGECDFLPWIPEDDYDFGYKQMYDSVDAIIMGRITYEWIISHSPAGQWPYADKRCYIYSRTPCQGKDMIEFVNEEPEELLHRICSAGAGRVWLMGGGEIIRMFLQKGLIDVVDIFYAPVLIGGGTPICPGGFPLTDLVLGKTVTRDRLVEILYRNKESG